MKRLGDVIDEMRHAGRMDKGIKVQSLGEVWPAIQSLWGKATVGAYIAQNSRPAQFKNGVLTILCANPSIMQVLNEQNGLIVQRLNKHLGSDIIRNLAFGLENTGDVQIRRSPPEPASSTPDASSLESTIQLTPKQVAIAEKTAEKIQNVSLRLAFLRAYEAWMRWSIWRRMEQQRRHISPAKRNK